MNAGMSSFAYTTFRSLTMFEATDLSNLFYFAMPRVTKADLERENAELKAELVQRRERSRSRRRKAQFVAAPMDATTRRALDVVCKHDRDGVVEEQRATIARQAQEIAALRNGSGPIGPILVANWPQGAVLSGSLLEKIAGNREPVGAFIKRIQKMASAIDSELFAGYHSGTF